MKPGKMPGGLNMGAMMKQAQKLQQDMAKLQAELETREYTASSGGGVVTATVTGRMVKSLVIAPEAIDPEDPDMLCDMILAAVNEALSQAEETTQREMGKLTGGMPGLF
jgi:DNA-binding YbaB/EbfC family protein